MVNGMVRDSAFGHIVRLISRNKAFQFPEEIDPSIASKYYNAEKTRNLCRYGTTTEPKETEPDHQKAGEADGHDTPTDDKPPAQRAPDSDTTLTNTTSKNFVNAPVDAERGRDLTVVDWDGPNDPENPKNWSLMKKFFVTFQICLLTTGVYIGSAIYTPGVEQIMEQFGVSQVAATLGLTLFVAGYGLGPMLWSPMSEVPQIGRTPIYIGTLFIFVLFQIPTALPSNFGMLLAFRFLTGLFGSPVLATGGATLADVYVPKKAAYAISIWGLAAVCGPTLGPLVSGFPLEYKPWNWAIWELMWISGFALAFLFFLLPETSSANILFRKARRLRKLTGNTDLISEPELAGEQMTRNEIVKMILIRPFSLNFYEPMLFLLNLNIALIYALLYCWLESFPIVFVEGYRFPLGSLGLAFLGIFIGVLIVVPPYFWYLYKVQEPQFDENGNIEPEKRLPPALVGTFFIPICMFFFGWSANRTHWIVPIIGSGFFGAGAFLMFNGVLNYLGDAYPNYVASVYAGNDLMRSAFGAGFPLFASAMYKNLGTDWASSLLGFLGIAFIPIPFVLYKYGRTLRVNHSKFARKDI